MGKKKECVGGGFRRFTEHLFHPSCRTKQGLLRSAQLHFIFGGGENICKIFLLLVFSSICKIFLLPVFSICNIQLYTHLNFPNINKLNVPLFFFLVRVIFIYGHESLDVDCGDVNIVCVHLSSHAKAELYIFS